MLCLGDEVYLGVFSTFFLSLEYFRLLMRLLGHNPIVARPEDLHSALVWENISGFIKCSV